MRLFKNYVICFEFIFLKHSQFIVIVIVYIIDTCHAVASILSGMENSSFKNPII